MWKPFLRRGSPPKTVIDLVLQVNESLYQFHKPDGVPRMQIIFFHGLQSADSSDDYLQTWKSEDGSCSWPKQWLAKEFPQAHMLFASYNGHVGKSSEGSLDMYNLVENILFDLIDAGIGQIPNCPLVLVGHCFGGLIIKQLCVRAIEEVGRTTCENKKAKLKALVRNMRGLFFYGTPHYGNRSLHKLADGMKSSLLNYFKTSSKEAVRLNSEFDQLQKGHPLWRIGGLGENLENKSGLFLNLVAAPEESARQGDQFNVLAVDHVSVCRPSNTTDRRFYALTNLLQNIASDLVATHQCLGLPDYPIQLQRRADDIIQSLKREHVLGIYGMGGVGKTTLAKEVFNKISGEFEYTCFMENVKGIGLNRLGSTLLSSFHCGRSRKRWTEWSNLRDKCTLIVMDDVDSEEQLKFLPKLGHLGKNSSLLITSRDKNIFKFYNACGLYEVEFLEDVEAMELFCQHAFKQEKIPEYPDGNSILGENVKAIVEKCGGLPLTLEVMGRYLRGYEHNAIMWEEARNKLANVKPINGAQNDRLWATLRLSYDALSRQEKEMFIDAGTFFYGERLDHALAAWRGAHGDSQASWENLVNRSMVREVEVLDSETYHAAFSPCISEHKVVWVHEQLRDLATKLAEGHMVNVSTEAAVSDATDLLNSKRMGANTKVVRICWPASWEYKNSPRQMLQFGSLQYLKELIYLDLKYVPHEGGGEEVIRKLSLLRWSRHGEDSVQLLPISLKDMNKLAVLELASCAVSEEFLGELGNCTTLVVLSLEQLHGPILLPEAFCCLSRLKVLSLTNLSFHRLPESFGSLSALEKLEISYCEILTSLPASFGVGLRLLKDLRIRFCSSLKYLPDSFSQLSGLKFLIILRCGSLETLGNSFGDLRALECFHIHGCENLTGLPDTFGDGLTSLKELYISGCNSLKCLPDSFGNLSQLEQLELGSLPLRTLPESFGNLSTLQKLRFTYCGDLSMLPASFGRGLKMLKELAFHHCNSLKDLRDSFYQLLGLEVLEIHWCLGLVDLGDSFGNLTSLRHLSLENTGLRRLPSSVWSLSSLVEFNFIALSDDYVIRPCSALVRRYPSHEMNPYIESDDLQETRVLITLPERFRFPRSLRRLRLSSEVLYLPESLGDLAELEVCHLTLTGLEALPTSMRKLSSLRTLTIDCKDLKELPCSLWELDTVEHLEIAAELVESVPDDIRRLRSLRELYLSLGSIRRLPDSIGELSSLQELTIGAPKLDSLPDTFGNLSSLQELTIRAPKLDSLPDTFGNLSALQVLKVERGGLRSLPESFGCISSLRKLVMSHCPLHELPETFLQLQRLEHIGLTETSLETVPNLTNLRSLKFLFLSWRPGARYPIVPECLGAVNNEYSSMHLVKDFEHVDGNFVDQW